MRGGRQPTVDEVQHKVCAALILEHFEHAHHVRVVNLRRRAQLSASSSERGGVNASDHLLHNLHLNGHQTQVARAQLGLLDDLNREPATVRLRSRTGRGREAGSLCPRLTLRVAMRTVAKWPLP